MARTEATSENAVHLLGAASELGLSKFVVKVKDGNLEAPDEVFDKAGFDTAKDGYATYPTKGTTTARRPVSRRTVDETKTPASAAGDDEAPLVVSADDPTPHRAADPGPPPIVTADTAEPVNAPAKKTAARKTAAKKTTAKRTTAKRATSKATAKTAAKTTKE